MSNTSRSNISAKPPRTPQPNTGVLGQHLSQLYALCPRASKHTYRTRPFKIAGPDPSDTWDWSITAGVFETDILVLVLQSLPCDEALIKFVSQLGGRVIPKFEHATFVIHLSSSDADEIRQLARKIREVRTQKWTWLSERAANALVRLAGHLSKL